MFLSGRIPCTHTHTQFDRLCHYCLKAFESDIKICLKYLVTFSHLVSSNSENVTLFSSKMCTLAILKINACRLTFAIQWLVLLSQPLYLACFRKPTEKARVTRQAFISKIDRLFSSLERSVNCIIKVLRTI